MHTEIKAYPIETVLTIMHGLINHPFTDRDRALDLARFLAEAVEADYGLDFTLCGDGRELTCTAAWLHVQFPKLAALPPYSRAREGDPRAFETWSNDVVDRAGAAYLEVVQYPPEAWRTLQSALPHNR